MDLSRIKGAEIHCADSADLIKTIPDASVDLILTDPPYNLGNYSRGNIKVDWRADFNSDIAAWDNETFDPAAWLQEFKRILKPASRTRCTTSSRRRSAWGASG